jgi:hypothetical protein
MESSDDEKDSDKQRLKRKSKRKKSITGANDGAHLSSPSTSSPSTTAPADRRSIGDTLSFSLFFMLTNSRFFSF